jgi:hypothetical protein
MRPAPSRKGYGETKKIFSICPLQFQTSRKGLVMAEQKYIFFIILKKKWYI